MSNLYHTEVEISTPFKIKKLDFCNQYDIIYTLLILIFMKNNKEDGAVKAVSVKGIFVGFSIGVLICIVTYLCFLGVGIFKARQEIGFAIRKPEIVKVIMDQYDKKQKEIDQNFSKTQQTAEEKFLEAVTQEIKK